MLLLYVQYELRIESTYASGGTDACMTLAKACETLHNNHVVILSPQKMFVQLWWVGDKRPPQRLAGRKPLMAPGVALSSSLAPIEPHGFDPRLLDKEALCIGSGISRGASLTRYGQDSEHEALFSSPFFESLSTFVIL